MVVCGEKSGEVWVLVRVVTCSLRCTTSNAACSYNHGQQMCHPWHVYKLARWRIWKEKGSPKSQFSLAHQVHRVATQDYWRFATIFQLFTLCAHCSTFPWIFYMI
jgi:hypothetical protein